MPDIEEEEMGAPKPKIQQEEDWLSGCESTRRRPDGSSFFSYYRVFTTFFLEYLDNYNLD